MRRNSKHILNSRDLLMYKSGYKQTIIVGNNKVGYLFYFSFFITITVKNCEQTFHYSCN